MPIRLTAAVLEALVVQTTAHDVRQIEIAAGDSGECNSVQGAVRE
jgi:hypothetical protein